MKLVAGLIIVAACASSVVAHDSPIDHIDRVIQVYAEDGRLHVVYRFRIEERQAMLQLHRMDADRDGRIAEGERIAYFAAVAEELTRQLRVEVAGRQVKLASVGPVVLGPDLSQTYHLAGDLGELAAGSHAAKLTDDFSRTHPGPYRWSPRQVQAGRIKVEASAAPRVEQQGTHPSMIVTDFRVDVAAAPAAPRVNGPDRSR